MFYEVDICFRRGKKEVILTYLAYADSDTEAQDNCLSDFYRRYPDHFDNITYIGSSLFDPKDIATAKKDGCVNTHINCV